MQLAINGQPIECNEKHKAPAKHHLFMLANTRFAKKLRWDGLVFLFIAF
jgi:hypothetical protein